VLFRGPAGIGIVVLVVDPAVASVKAPLPALRPGGEDGPATAPRYPGNGMAGGRPAQRDTSDAAEHARSNRAPGFGVLFDVAAFQHDGQGPPGMVVQIPAGIGLLEAVQIEVQVTVLRQQVVAV